jgi:hypothetical protein
MLCGFFYDLPLLGSLLAPYSQFRDQFFLVLQSRPPTLGCPCVSRHCGLCDVMEKLSVLLKMQQDPVCCKGMNSMNNLSSFGTGIQHMVQIIMPQVLCD